MRACVWACMRVCMGFCKGVCGFGCVWVGVGVDVCGWVWVWMCVGGCGCLYGFVWVCVWHPPEDLGWNQGFLPISHGPTQTRRYLQKRAQPQKCVFVLHGLMSACLCPVTIVPCSGFWSLVYLFPSRIVYGCVRLCVSFSLSGLRSTQFGYV